MPYSSTQKLSIPLSERLKNIPGFFGIRLSEEPKYKVLDMEDDKEIREYESMTLATVTIPGSYDEAVKEGYKRLTQYLFGANAKSQEMQMITPIYEEQNQNSWTISFILPKEMNTTTAPTPHDHSISISERPSHKVAVIWYTGGNDLERVLAKSAELLGWIQTKRGVETAGEIRIAQYDSPSTLDFFRRNELQVEVKEISNSDLH